MWTAFRKAARFELTLTPFGINGTAGCPPVLNGANASICFFLFACAIRPESFGCNLHEQYLQLKQSSLNISHLLNLLSLSQLCRIFCLYTLKLLRHVYIFIFETMTIGSDNHFTYIFFFLFRGSSSSDIELSLSFDVDPLSFDADSLSFDFE